MDSNSVLKILDKEYPDAEYYLQFSTAAQLVVASILSAQMRDDGVNAATAEIFKECKTAKDFTTKSEEELLSHFKNITFANAKIKNIMKTVSIIAEKHKNKVPETVEALTELPGIGKKTALVILTNAFNKVEGIVVDTHVIRVANRLGLVKTKNADKIEEELRKKTEKRWWKKAQWLFKAHGRKICRAPTPSCSKCVFSNHCPKAGVTKQF